MDAILYRPSHSLEGALEAYLQDKEEDFFRLSNYVDSTLKAAREKELAFHLSLLGTYCIEDPNMTASQYELSIKRIQAQRSETRGRRPKYKASRRNPVYARAVRIWLMNELVAKALNVPFIEPPPPEPPIYTEDAAATYLYIETIDSILRFEEYTGYTLPRLAYVLHTRDDRALLATMEEIKPLYRHHDWTEDGRRCLKFEEYALLRQNPEILQKMREFIFSKKSAPIEHLKQVA